MMIRQYLENVLGIKSVILPLELFSEAKQKMAFLVEKDLSPESLALFHKMTEAMKLAAGDFDLLVIGPHSGIKSVAHLQTYDCFISFVPHFESELKEKFPQSFVLATEGPDILLKNATFKRKVWSDLQIAMKYRKEKFATQVSNK